MAGRSAVLRGLLPLAPLVLYLAVLFVYPVSKMVALSFTGAAAARYHELWAAPLYRHVFAETFTISVVVTLVCLVLGYPVAYTLTLLPVRSANLLLILVVTPFWISILARSFLWMILLGRAGVVNQILLGLHLIRSPLPLVYDLTGVYIAMIHILLPFMILSLYGVMRGIDMSLLRAASNLGAGDWYAFRRVFLPLSVPGITAGCLILFVVGLGFFITPALLGGGQVTTVAMLIEAHIHRTYDLGLASALAFALLAATALVLLAYNRVLRLDQLFGER